MGCPSSDENSTGPSKLDFFFRCNYCIKVIREDDPIFMSHDLWYCSSSCRKRGRSRLYSNLRCMQLEHLQELASISESNSGSIPSCISESRLGMGAREASIPRSGALSWLVNKVFGAVSARLPATPLLHASSSFLKHFQPDSQMHQLLTYIPGAGGVLDQLASCTTEGVLGSAHTLTPVNSIAELCRGTWSTSSLQNFINPFPSYRER